MADLVYTDGDFTEAMACSLPLFSAPFQAVNVDYVLEQDFMQFDANRVPLALGTEHPEYATFLLAFEGPKQDLGGGVVKWTRTYAMVPTSFNEPDGNYAYNFIGIYGDFGPNVTTPTGRDRFTRNVPVSVTRDFFLVDGVSLPSYLDIPIISATRYYYSGNPSFDIDYVADSPPFAAATVPSQTEYLAMVAADAADQDSLSIIVEESSVERWMGNIYMRVTRRVRAI